MFAFDSSLFWYKLVFVTELMIAEGFATYTLPKRRGFALRAVLSALGVYAVAFLFPVFFVGPAVNTVTLCAMFLALFAVTVAALKVCYDERLLILFFCGIVAYTTQHISYATFTFIVNTSGLGSFHVYGESPMEMNNPLSYMIYFGVYGLIYWFVWAFVEHKMREQEKLAIEPLLLFSFSAILFVDIVLNAVVVYYVGDILGKVGETVLYLYRLMTSMFVYVVLFSVLGKRLAEHELEAVESLWEQDRRNFEFSRENIDLINMKVHDLKHQIRKLKEGGGLIDGAYLSELENSVTIYDHSLKTGCEALDLLFAENSVYLAGHKIRLSVIADGEALSFMSNADIYSLFGNALHNAIEALAGIEEEKRVIRMAVRRQGKMVSVHAENYCEGVQFGQDGLPKTQKGERGHGYGMRSMRMVAEKYGGFLTAEVRGNLFILDIVIPFSPKEERKTE